MTEAGALRIAVVGPFSPLRGGIAQFDDALAGALRARGHDVLPISFARLYPGLLFPGTSQFAEGAKPFDGSEAVVDAVAPWTWSRSARRIRGWEPDAVVIPWWTAPMAPALGWIARRAGAPAIGLLHNALPHDALPLSKPLTRWFLRGLSGAVALSDAVATDARALGLRVEPAVAMHPPYDRFGPPTERAAARRELGLTAEAPVLLFFGLIRPYKGLDILVEAMPAIRHAHPGTTLLVAGEAYADLAPLRDRIGALDLDAAVRLDARFVPDEDVSRLFGAADVVVQPYRRATQSGVLAAAAHFGVPAVVTDAGGLAAHVRRFDAGEVAAGGDPASVAAAVVRALDPARRAELAAGMRALAEASTWSGFADVVAGAARNAAARKTASRNAR